MTDFREDLEAHLKQFRAAPFLFVGAGVAQRFLGLDDWEGLLRRMAAVIGKPYDFYVASGDNDYPTIATRIAEDMHDLWWSDDRFAPTRKKYEGKLKTRESALKAEASEYLAGSLSNLPTSGGLAQELDLLRAAVIDGVITTNFDPLLEECFPGFEVYVGQGELLIDAPQGVGEIYKIHGTYQEPDSLVLTRGDYDGFHSDNAYLAAKLMTIFVEHPVVFLGYSMSDPNVATILEGIVSGLKTPERIERLAGRLMFVIWDNDVRVPTMVKTVRPVGSVQVPIYALTVPDYVDVLSVLGGLTRSFPAKLLRKLKEQVYELVLEKDVRDRLYVDIDPSQDPRDVDVVFGVGAIGRVRAYVGLSRDDLVADVVHEDRDLAALRVVQEALPHIFSHPGNVPVYKYLRGAGLLDDSGQLVDPKQVDERVAKAVSGRSKRLGLTRSYQRPAEKAAGKYGTLAKMIRGEPEHNVLNFLPALDEAKIDPGELKQFLIASEPSPGTQYRSQWVKMVCLYDWLVYGLQLKPRRRRTGKGKTSPRKAKGRAS